jgi:hypothetical protein
LLIAVVPEILADIVRRVADDNIGGVGFDPSYNDTVFVVYFIDLYILLYRLRRRRRRCRNRRGGEVDEITLLTSSGSPTGLTLFCNSNQLFLVLLLYLESPCSSRKVRSLIV